MPDETKNELLINALLDDQLDATEAQRVKQQIANDKTMSNMLTSFQEQRAAISALPKFQLDDDFADRIVEIGAAELAAVPTVNRPAAPVSKVDWKRYAMSLAAIAALLMGMLVYQWTPGGQETAVLTPTANVAGTSSSSDNDQISSFEKQAMSKSTNSPSDFADADESEGAMDDATPAPEALAALPAPSPAPPAMRSRSAKRQLLAKDEYAFNEYDEEADDLDAEKFQRPGDFALGVTAMAAPEPLSQPPIDQVWLMEVGESYSQKELVSALTSNSISVPAELQSIADESNATIELNGEVDGIQVAAKRSQMRRALSQLSQSDAVTISAFQLPNQAGLNGRSNSDKAEPSVDAAGGAFSGGAPATITPPSRAMAQRLRGNYFASPSPSSKMPESFSQLEKMMGVEDLTKADNAPESIAKKEAVEADSAIERDLSFKLSNEKEMAKLFPDSESDSDVFSNFVIIIRNEAKPKK